MGYSWGEVKDIQETGHRAYCGPFGDYEDSLFKLIELDIEHINKKNYLTVGQCNRMGLDEDLSVIMRLSRLIADGVELPPIILDRDYNIIDGSHRVPAYLDNGIKRIDAFIEI